MTNSTNIKAEIAAAKNLDELLEVLSSYDDDEVKLDEIANLAGLPTFGGDEPENTDGIWSWDADNLLTNGYGQSQFVIESRADYYA